MSTHNKEAAERGNDLADQWERELIAEMAERRNKARRAADACKEGGWFRQQIEMQVSRYDAVLSALTASEAPATEQAPESIGDRYAHRLAVMLECSLLDPNGTWNDAHKLLDEYRAEHERIHPSPPTHMGEPLIVANAPRPGQVDWMGLAIELEQQAKRVDSQTVERAMNAGAHGLRLMGAALRSEQAPSTAAHDDRNWQLREGDLFAPKGEPQNDN